MSQSIAILSLRGETVISSSRVCNIFYNIVTVLSSTLALDSRKNINKPNIIICCCRLTYEYNIYVPV